MRFLLILVKYLLLAHISFILLFLILELDAVVFRVGLIWHIILNYYIPSYNIFALLIRMAFNFKKKELFAEDNPKK